MLTFLFFSTMSRSTLPFLSISILKCLLLFYVAWHSAAGFFNVTRFINPCSAKSSLIILYYGRVAVFVSVCKCGVWLHAEVKENHSDIYSYNLNHANNEKYALQWEDFFIGWKSINLLWLCVCVCMQVHLLQIECLLQEECVGKLKCILDEGMFVTCLRVQCVIFVPPVAFQMELQSICFNELIQYT